MNRNDLIAELVTDLQPVRHPGSIIRPAAAWIGLSTAFTLSALLANGPLRPGALQNLAIYPWYTVEALIGGACVVSLAMAVLGSSIPGLRWTRTLLLPSALGAMWVSIYVVGLWVPAHPVSDIGRREHCVLEALSFGLPGFVALLWMTRRLLPLQPRTTGALAGAAAASLPALGMQFACMYSPQHTLLEHIGPVFVAAGLGALFGPLVLPRRVSLPKRRDHT